jgi:hypothetical protein
LSTPRSGATIRSDTGALQPATGRPSSRALPKAVISRPRAAPPARVLRAQPAGAAQPVPPKEPDRLGFF